MHCALLLYQSSLQGSERFQYVTVHHHKAQRSEEENMQETVITTIGLPVALGIIMLGLGLSLTWADFTRVFLFPKAILVGLFVQTLLLPVVCFFVASYSGLSPTLAVGLMLLAASPGGATANLYSHLAKGDVALNISLTAINSVLSLLTLPLILNFALEHFLQEGQYIPPQTKKIVEVAAMIILPVLIGMFIRKQSESVAGKLNKPVRVLSVLILVALVAATLLKDKATIVEFFASVGLAALAFNVLSMFLGYVIPRLFRIEKRQAIAIGMEIGIHNGALAIFIALNVLKNNEMSLPPAIYSLIMFVTAALFGVLVNCGAKEEA